MKESARRVHLSEAQTEGLADADDTRAGTSHEMDAVWESEWREHLLQRALRQAQETVTARSIQIFQLSTVQGWSIEEIAAALCISRAMIYLARHRVGRLVKREIQALRQELE